MIWAIMTSLVNWSVKFQWPLKDDTRKVFHPMIAQRIWKKAVNRPREWNNLLIFCPKTLWFSKTKSRKAQKQAQFRDRSIENATEKGSVVPVSWAISGERNHELREHKNMILNGFESFEWWWKRIIKHMHKNDQWVLTHNFVNDSVGLWRTCWSNYTRNPRNMRKYLAENAPLQRQLNYQFICWVGK